MRQEFISDHHGKTATATFQRRKLRLRGFRKLPRCTAGKRKDRKSRPSSCRMELAHLAWSAATLVSPMDRVVPGGTQGEARLPTSHA